MNKLVVINQSVGYLTIDTVNAYATQYDEIALITGRVGQSERKLNDSIKIEKIIAYNKSSVIKRILTWVIAFIQIFFLLCFKYRKYEVVYVTNPPISYLASLILKRPFSVIVYDTYPDALRNVGIKKGHWLYEMWSKWNRKLFNNAKCVFTLSEGMAQQISNYVDRSRIKVVPLWPASESFAPINKEDNPFVLKHSLKDKFVVLYSGNMGYTHNVDTLVEVAAVLRDKNNIHFLFIGDGKKKKDMMQIVEEKQLRNCTFMDYQPFDVLPYSLASADLGVVTLNEETALTSVPSKTFNLLAVGAPLLCIAPKISEIANLIEKYNNGEIYDAHEINEIASFIIELSQKLEKKKMMSAQSLKAAKTYTKENALMYLYQL